MSSMNALARAQQLDKEHDQTLRCKAQALKEKIGQIHVSHLLPGEKLGKLGRRLIEYILSDRTRCNLWISSFFEGKRQQRILEIIMSFCRNSPPEDPVTLTLKILSCQMENRIFLTQIVNHLVEYELWDVIDGIYDYVNDPLSSLELDNLPAVVAALPDISPILKEEEISVTRTTTGNQSHTIKRKRKALKGIVLLTFAHDGVELAEQLKYYLMHPSESGYWFDVYMLKDIDFQDICGDLPFILRKVDYVVPILTPGYEELILSQRFDPLAPIDVRYAPAIYKMLFKEYCNNNMRNKRVRCFLSEEGKSILSSSTLNHALILESYCSDFEDLRKYLQ